MARLFYEFRESADRKTVSALAGTSCRQPLDEGIVLGRADALLQDGKDPGKVARQQGSGIEPQLGERIFEPFAQGPSRVAGTNGSAGLGLAIARAIVEAHGGRIWIAAGGQGTHVRFRLPAA